MRQFLLACLTSLTFGALVSPAASAQPAVHPLAGKVFDTHSGAITGIADKALLPKLFPCGAITLLGEVHDNGAHHQMRADLVRDAVSRTDAGCHPDAFVFEHFAADQQAKVDLIESFDADARRRATAADLFRFVDWDKSGWPPAKLFAPLMQVVVSSGRPILAGNPPGPMTRKTARDGLAALSPELVHLLGLDKALAADLDDDLLGELEASHCGLMPKAAFGNMAVAQRYRDAQMANVALEAARNRGSVVVFAGNGHIRSDRGVPWYIRQRAPDHKVVSVAFVETEAGRNDPADYGPNEPAGKPAADFVAFALPATREDPCEQMRKHMKK